MKQISIRLKITLWYTVTLVVMVLFTCFIVFFVSNQILQKTVRDNLIEAIEHNVDEIEYFPNLQALEETNDVDHYIQYQDGYLEIDDDFLNQVNEVYTSLYRSEDAALLYGENPISKETAELPFANSQVQKIKVDGTLYYIFDRMLTREGLQGLYLRGVVSELQGKGQMTDIVRISMVLLPALVLLSIFGGYWIAGRMLRPIHRLSQMASQIEKGGDLKKRIDIGKGNDELHQLADRFNAMFGRLDEAFEAERQFASDASHELRTPMSVITAQCEYLLEKQRSAEEYKQSLRVIQRQSNKMAGLIRDMLDFARLEARADSYARERVDLSELVRSLCADLALIAENGITLKAEVEAGVICVGNRELLSRLLTNLVSNAYRYGKENGHILVKLMQEGGRIALSVCDDGIGIAKEEQSKIFRRFYQADNSRSSAGTGLGLAMAYEIAQFHGGALSVESELGKGSVFTLQLPGLEDNAPENP